MNPPASIAAWYGAVVSTLGFSLALFVALRDRQRLKITMQPNMRSFGETGYREDKLYLMVTVSNVGRRPVTIEAVGFNQRRRAGDLLLSDSTRQGSKEITEGKSAIYLVEQDGFPFTNLKHVIVRDATGRVWKRRVPSSLRRVPFTAKSKPLPLEP
jgi:hypothetical protein